MDTVRLHISSLEKIDYKNVKKDFFRNVANMKYFEVDLKFGDGRVNVYVHGKKDFRSVLLNGLSLTYCPDLFKKYPDIYIPEQVDNHSRVLKNLQNTSDEYSKELAERERIMSQFIDLMPSLPNLVVRFWVAKAKFRAALFSLRKFRTLKSRWKDQIEMARVLSFTYGVVNSVMDYGKDFVEQKVKNPGIPLCSESRADLEEWYGIQQDLSRVSRNLADNLEGILRLDKRDFGIFYPNN